MVVMVGGVTQTHAGHVHEHMHPRMTHGCHPHNQTCTQAGAHTETLALLSMQGHRDEGTEALKTRP